MRGIGFSDSSGAAKDFDRDAPVPKSLIIDSARASYRAWGEDHERTILCLHGNPTSSYLYRALGSGLEDMARVIAPDLPGLGDSELGHRAGTWEEMEEFVERFVEQTGIRRFDLVLHDWGGLIGFRWLFDHPDRLQQLHKLVVSDTGFFPADNSAWHPLARIWRTPGEGEAWMDAVTFDGFRDGMRANAPAMPDDAVREYWKSHATHERRLAKLILYRSGDLQKIRPYDGRLAALTCPTLIMWGEKDPFLPVAIAHMFNHGIPDSTLRVLSGTGHFIWEEAPEPTVSLVRHFLLS